MTAALNPDCKAGAHKACAGDAWDEERDEPTSCSCPHHAEPTHVVIYRESDRRAAEESGADRFPVLAHAEIPARPFTACSGCSDVTRRHVAALEQQLRDLTTAGDVLRGQLAEARAEVERLRIERDVANDSIDAASAAGAEEVARLHEHIAYHLRDFRPGADDKASGDLAVDMGAYADRMKAERDEARAALAELRKAVEAGEASDGHHTHRELYDYRLLYNAHAAHGWLAAGLPVVKSRHHSDGEPCFGGGWFIVTATLPTGQVSNHYRDEHWDLFDVPAVDLPPEYDGHTPADAADRLRAALTPTTGTGGRDDRRRY